MIINTKTDMMLQAFVNRPSSSILLIGNEDTGVTEIIDQLVSKLLRAENRNNIVILEPEDGKAITVEQVRVFKSQLQTKVSVKNEVSRVAIAKELSMASLEAQNAMLKLLEEPVPATVLVLQASSKQHLLETIQSRCQIVPILPITEKQASNYAQKNGIDEQAASRALLISSGYAKAFLTALDQKDMVEEMISAKNFLSLTVFDRLQKQKEFDKRQALFQLCDNLEKIASAGMHASTSTKRWQTILHEIRTCREMIERNVTVKLVFLRLCTNL